MRVRRDSGYPSRVGAPWLEQRHSHVAITVPRTLFDAQPHRRLLTFYEGVFGWSENRGLTIPGERLVLRSPTITQFLTIRASDEPMKTSGYEHLGITVPSAEAARELYDRASRWAQREEGVELGELSVRYSGRVHTFRVQYMLPLAIEVQFFDTSGAPS